MSEPEPPSPEAEGRACSHDTREGEPCRTPPMAGADRCIHHAGLPRTAAQQEASRRNARKSGLFAKLLNAEDLERLALAREALGHRGELQEDMVAYGVMLLGRLEAREAEHGPSPLQLRAWERVSKAIDAWEAPPMDLDIDYEQLDFIVEETSKNPEVFLKRLPVPVAEEVRAVLRKAGIQPPVNPSRWPGEQEADGGPGGSPSGEPM